MRYPTVTADLSQFEFNKSGTIINPSILLSKEESHHLTTVLRLKVGDRISLLCPNSNRRFEARIANLGKEVHLEIIKEIDPSTILRCPVYALIFALCKGEKNDLVAEKACELGVSKVFFWHATRSVIKLKDQDDINKKIERWNKITLSAAKQCGTYLCTKVTYEKNIQDVINTVNKLQSDKVIDGKFTCSLEENSKKIVEIPTTIKSSVIVIGPEGDLTQDESKLLINNGFLNLTLGPLILRAETAAISSIAAFNSHFGFVPINN